MFIELLKLAVGLLLFLIIGSVLSVIILSVMAFLIILPTHYILFVLPFGYDHISFEDAYYFSFFLVIVWLITNTRVYLH